MGVRGEQQPDADVRAVLDLLRHDGPRTLTELRERLGQGSWGRERVEHAVVEAWSENRVTVDLDDRLVAL